MEPHKTAKMLTVEKLFHETPMVKLLGNWYFLSKLTTTEIAEKVTNRGIKISRVTIDIWLKELGFTIYGRSHPKKSKTKKKRWVSNAFGASLNTLLRQWYCEDKLTVKEIVEKIGVKGISVSDWTIRDWLEKADINIRRKRDAKRKTPKMIAVQKTLGQGDIERVLPALYNAGYSSGDIQQLTNGIVGCGQVLRWLKGWGVAMRPLPDALRTERHRNKASQNTKMFFANHPEVWDVHRIRFQQMWQERRRVLERCQKRMDSIENTPQKFVIHPEEKQILVSLAKSQHKQAKELLFIERTGRFERIALRHMNVISRVALYYTKDENDAKDLAQDTFIKAFRFFDQYREETNYKAWLLKILENTFYSDFNYRKKHPTIPFSKIVENEIELSGDANPEIEIFKGLIDDDLSSAINELPVAYRKAVLMVDIEGLSYQETSEILKCSVNAIGKRLYRGRKLLKISLSDYAKSHGYIK